MHVLKLSCVLLSAWTFGALVLAEEVRAGKEAPLIPREVLFGNPDKASLQISPDGRHISYLAPVENVLNVWVAPMSDPSAARPVTNDTYRGIRSYFWAFTGKHIIYIQDKGGDENWHVFSVDLENDKIRDLTPFENVQARVEKVSRHFPNEILVGINNRNPQLHDIHRVNISTGEMSLAQENTEGFAGFLSDDDLKVYFGIKMTPDGGSQLHRRAKDGSWTLFATIPPEDTLTTNALYLDKSGKRLYMLDSRGRNTAALTLVDIDTREARTLAEDSKADVSGVMVHPTEEHVQAAYSTYERRQWRVLDKSIEKDFNTLSGVADGDFYVTSRTLDDRYWAVAYIMDAGPVRYFLYDRDTRKAEFLFTNRKDLEQYDLSPMHPATLKARDGLNLVCYYTLPTWADADKDGVPSEALPTVLLVHGGPWARDAWGFNPMHQWLANRGYAVLSVNYRGSTGFGKAFVNAGNHEWAGKMHDDLLDAVQWSIRKGIADEKRVAIMGGSYGGYATLVGLTFTPDVFACGVDIVGPSSLVTLLESIPPYWKPMLDVFTQRVGDHQTENGRAMLTERSPLHRADKIRKPLLIGQGANDPRVKQAESDQIVSAMQKKDIPVTYVLFPDEGHGFARPDNRKAFFAVSEGFLAQHLGGRHEPITEAIEDSTMLVPAGADAVPGLPPTIKARSTGEPS